MDSGLKGMVAKEDKDVRDGGGWRSRWEGAEKPKVGRSREKRQEWNAVQGIKSYFYLLYFPISGEPALELLTSSSFTPSTTNTSAFLFSIYFGAMKNLAMRKRRSMARLGEEEKTFRKSQTMESPMSLEKLSRASSGDSSSPESIDRWISSMMEVRDQTALPTEPRSREGGRGWGGVHQFLSQPDEAKGEGDAGGRAPELEVKERGGLAGEGVQGGIGREDGPRGLRATDLLLLLGSSVVDGGTKGLDGFVDKEKSGRELCPLHQNF